MAAFGHAAVSVGNVFGNALGLWGNPPPVPVVETPQEPQDVDSASGQEILSDVPPIVEIGPSGFVAIRTSKKKMGVQFFDYQTSVMSDVMRKFDNYDGIILKAYMGAGKTVMSMGIMQTIRAKSESRANKIVVIMPDGLEKQWKDEWEGYVHQVEFWPFEKFVEESKKLEFGQPIEQEYYIIFDECHKIRTLTQTLSNEDADKVCQFMGKKAIKRLGLTGTLIYYDKDDLLYEVNAFAGTDGQGRWPLPFTWTHLTNVYRDTQGDTYGLWYALKSIFGGWIFNLENLRIFPIPDFLALADIGDFYLNQYSPYNEPKREIVGSILSAIPGFDKAVLNRDLKGLIINGPLTILSIMSFTTMMNPFSYLIPTIFAMVSIEDQNTFNDLDKIEIQTKICPMIVNVKNINVDDRGSLANSVIQHIDWVANKKNVAIDRAGRAVKKIGTKLGVESKEPEGTPEVYQEIYQEAIYKWPGIEQFCTADDTEDYTVAPSSVFITARHQFEEIPYTWSQLQLFIRFTNNRLTPCEAEMLHMKESQRTMTRHLTMHDLETTGLRIGSLDITKSKLKKIQDGNNDRKIQFRKTVERITQQNVQPPVLDKSDPEKYEGVPKFDEVIRRINASGVHRVLLYSQFEEVSQGFKEYIRNRKSAQTSNWVFKNSESKIQKHEFNHEARQDVRNERKYIMVLSPLKADGYDGLQDVDTMIILEPCTTDSMKRQLIARVVRQFAHSKSRVVNIYEYVCTPGKLNMRRMGASIMDWWKHDNRVAYWVFRPLLNNTRTPDQVVVRSQQVSGEMEDICSGSAEDYVRGVDKKAKRALKTIGTDSRDVILGKYNFDILKEERKQLRERLAKNYTLADDLQLSRTTALLESELGKLKKKGAELSDDQEVVLNTLDQNRIKRELKLLSENKSLDDLKSELARIETELEYIDEQIGQYPIVKPYQTELELEKTKLKQLIWMNEFNTQKEARTRLSEGDRSQSDQDLTTLKDKVEDEIATLQSEIDELRRGQELYSVQTQKKKDLEDQKRLISEELGLLVNLALV
jgi:hypothetical protein